MQITLMRVLRSQWDRVFSGLKSWHACRACTTARRHGDGVCTYWNQHVPHSHSLDIHAINYCGNQITTYMHMFIGYAKCLIVVEFRSILKGSFEKRPVV